ncbi:hypothetical protein Tco_0977970 [Tanacetum coccineum]|uniref:Uncharacterized protein n=1 Tax=Tanacetum coccineum TaxID=301880 RepID=A0ABQ5ELL9_9ASTR
MCTYLKNLAGWKPKDLKTKSFANVQELFDKAMKRVNTFVDMDIELVKGGKVRAEGSEKIAQESSSKRAGGELEQENAKKQKVDVEEETRQEKVKLQSLMEIVFDEEGVTIDAIPLATKPPSIVDWKIVKEGEKSYYLIIRAGGQSNRPEEGYERVLWGDLKTMFEPNVEDEVWKMQQVYKGRIIGIKRLLDILKITAAKEGLEMERITPLDLLGDMKRQHALSNALSLLLRATSTITGNFIIILKGLRRNQGLVIMDYLVKISKKARILELKRRYLKITILTSNTPYPSRKIQRIYACALLKTTKEQDPIRRIQRRPIHRIQVMEIKYSGRYRT